MRIAFLTLNAYDILTGGHGGTAGGAQLQQSLIGRRLVRRGHDVFFIEHDTDLKQEAMVDGIRIVTKPKPRGSHLRRAVSATWGTVRKLHEIDPDVCYRRVLDFEMFPAYAYCRATDARFVYGFSHDSDLTADPNALSGPIKGSRPYRSITNRVLDGADALITQNEFQYDRAKARFDAEVHLVPNGYVIPEQSTKHGRDGGTPTVLWVSRFRPIKRPSLVLDVADRAPEVNFVMIGSRNDAALYDSVEAEAAGRENVEFVGYVPYDDIDRYFAEADVFLNTSRMEGFPNTFLQAWSHRTPVLSLDVDPNGVLADHAVGFCAEGDFDRLCDELARLATDDDERTRLGENAFSYFEANHGIDRVVDRFEAVLSAVA